MYTFTMPVSAFKNLITLYYTIHYTIIIVIMLNCEVYLKGKFVKRSQCSLKD